VLRGGLQGKVLGEREERMQGHGPVICIRPEWEYTFRHYP